MPGFVLGFDLEEKLRQSGEDPVGGVDTLAERRSVVGQRPIKGTRVVPNASKGAVWRRQVACRYRPG